ncbi:hypothetical protein OC834_003176 [Tilletia horrida]|nr:hypothetical protein OC834_003176 [Tilletia horrida]
MLARMQARAARRDALQGYGPRSSRPRRRATAHQTPSPFYMLDPDSFATICNDLGYIDLTALRGISKLIRRCLLHPRFDHALFREPCRPGVAEAVVRAYEDAGRAESQSMTWDGREGYILRAHSFPLELHPVLQRMAWTFRDGFVYSTWDDADFAGPQPAFLDEAATRPALSRLKIGAEIIGGTTHRFGKGGAGVTVRDVLDALLDAYAHVAQSSFKTKKDMTLLTPENRCAWWIKWDGVGPIAPRLFLIFQSVTMNKNYIRDVRRGVTTHEVVRIA